MKATEKVTKQGVRDLTDLGPKRPPRTKDLTEEYPMHVLGVLNSGLSDQEILDITRFGNVG